MRPHPMSDMSASFKEFHEDVVKWFKKFFKKITSKRK